MGLVFVIISSQTQKQCLLGFCSVFRTYICFSTCTVGSSRDVEYSRKSINTKRYSVDTIDTGKATDNNSQLLLQLLPCVKLLLVC